MSQHVSSVSSVTPVIPVVSDLFASYSDAQGFWIKERNVPTTKNEEGAAPHPLSSSLLNVDIARELRSAHYTRDKAKNEARFAQAQKSKRQGRPRRRNPTRRSTKGAKRSGKRQPISWDLAPGSESDCEQDLSGPVFSGHREAVTSPVRPSGNRRPISTPVSPDSQPPTKRTPKAYTPPDAYTTATLPESTLDVPSSDIARESRSYERHRNQTKKNARFKQSRQKKGIRTKPVRSRGSGSVKIKNLQNLVALAVIDGETTSEDEIQTPIEVSLSVVLPSIEYSDARTPVMDMEAMITTAKVKYIKGLSNSRISPPPPWY